MEQTFAFPTPVSTPAFSTFELLHGPMHTGVMLGNLGVLADGVPCPWCGRVGKLRVNRQRAGAFMVFTLEGDRPCPPKTTFSCYRCHHVATLAGDLDPALWPDAAAYLAETTAHLVTVPERIEYEPIRPPRFSRRERELLGLGGTGKPRRSLFDEERLGTRPRVPAPDALSG